MILALILIIIGSAFLLESLGYISGSTWGFIWPTILIVLGLGMLMKKLLRKKGHGFFWEERFGWREKREGEES